MKEPTSGPALVTRRGPSSSRLSAVFFSVVTVFGLAYLAAIPFGLVGANKFGSAEAIIFAALLFFNSSLIGRMESLVLSGRGVEMKMERFEQRQEEQQQQISTLRFLVSYFVNEGELRLLKKLVGDAPATYDEESNYFFHIWLRRLRDLGLLTVLGGSVAAVPKHGDLRTYCRITDGGTQYLAQRREVDTQRETTGGSIQ